jgi:multisubunit Na+/H+ antiporter MnhB subunit
MTVDRRLAGMLLECRAAADGCMPPAIASLTTRLFDASAVRAHAGRVVLVLILHLAALALLLLTESRPVPQLAFLLSWGFFNFCWIVLTRRPALAAALSLAFLVLLILISRFKHDVLLMTVNFVDLMIIDPDTVSFLIRVFPDLGFKTALTITLTILGLVLIWYFDPLRMRRGTAALGASFCLAGLVALTLTFPSDPWEEFYSENYFSKFTRSGVTALGDLVVRGVLESDASVSERLAAASPVCTATKPPHIIMVFPT